MALVAEISQTSLSAMSFGDTDHDGKNEVIVHWSDENYNGCYRILEGQENNVYSLEYSGANMLPYATGDLDHDGKAEIVGQGGDGSQLQVFESLSSASYPTQLIWSSPALSNVEGRTVVGDTDRDGRMEIIHSQNFFSGNSRLVIFENTGDNTYSQVASIDTGPGSTGDKVIADLDGDGLIEIAVCGVYGQLHIYESPADNTWAETWSESTGLVNAYGLAGGRDTDGDGKPELFVAGDLSGYATTIVYQATGDNRYARVATFRAYTGGTGGNRNALGNLDGVGGDEYLMRVPTRHVYVYRATAPGQWSLVEDLLASDTWHIGLHAYDVNRNGRDEVFWDTSAANLYTLVLEHPPVSPSSAGHDPGFELAPLPVSPNPCRVQAAVYLPSWARDGARLTVYDAAGRIVERRIFGRNVNAELLWPVQHLVPGVYFLELEDESGALRAAGRGTVVR